MKERSHTVQNEYHIDPNPFSPDFNENLGRMITESAKDFSKEAISKAGKFTAITSPLVLSACSGNTDQISMYLTPSAIAGHVAGLAMVVEEALEKDERSFGRKLISIGIKYGAGYTAGYAVTNNLQNGGSWLSPENITPTLTLIPASYALIKETKISELISGISKTVEGSISGSINSSREANFQRKILHLARQTRSPNIRVAEKAKEELSAMGIDHRSVDKILHNG